MHIRSIHRIILFILLFFGTIGFSHIAFASLDPPHDGSSNVTCISCHDLASSDPNHLPQLDHTPLAGDLDDTINNNLCWSCHKDINRVREQFIIDATHSSQSTSTTYGNWSMECSVCHNQHTQEQPGGKFIRQSINLAEITFSGTTPPKSGIYPVQFASSADFADGDSTFNGICEVCHTRTTHFRNDGTGPDQLHTNVGGAAGTNCITCHSHQNGFVHGNGSGADCEECHGHDAGYPGVTGGAGTFQSHSVHTEDDSDDRIGPRPVLACYVCHDTTKFPQFVDSPDLAGTAVCDGCHSKLGPYDGIDDPVIGAKNNWRTGVYSPDGTTLLAGMERWCVTCHDSGLSTINGRQAPDVAGDNSNYGYYASGHGRTGADQDCSACHGLNMLHNFDGIRTYAAINDNYKLGFRLKDVDGMDPLNIPLEAGAGTYNSDSFRLCYSCHTEESLLNDTKNHGCYDSTNNPYKNAASITTQFRNVHPQGHNSGANDIPANFHADHLIDVNQFFPTGFWYSDGPGTLSGDSGVTCVTCHNPHGDRRSDGSATIKMTAGAFEMGRGSDSYGEYGQVTSGAPYLSGDPQQICSVACHGSGMKWYYNAVPTLNSIGLSDAIPTDPAPAETGFSNNQSINVLPDDYGEATEIRCAEDSNFTINATAWTAYVSPLPYTLSSGDGGKTVYCKIRNTFGESVLRGANITLDTVNPTILAATLTLPNGSEVWSQGTGHTVTWTSSDITDTNLKAAPIRLAYSTDSGISYPNAIASGEANDGSYAWTAPLINTASVRVELTATDRAGNQAADTSDNDFTIQAVTATIDSFTVTDSNSGNPAPAESGYSNDQLLDVSITASNYPTEMRLAQDAAFTQNSTGWIPYNDSTTYTLAGGEGPKTVWLQLRNVAGVSGTDSFAITFDTTPPAFNAGTGAIITPNGSELWQEGETTRQITWNSSVTETNLKTNPITLEYSIDSGISFPFLIAANELNDGLFLWNPIPAPASYETRIRMTLTDRAGNRSSDVSDNDFIIKPPNQFIVTNTNDSGVGSLRQAILDIVAAGGGDSVWFDIPDDGSLTNGVALISVNSVTGNLPDLSAPGITIDGGSQAALVGDTNPRGPEVRIEGWKYNNNTPFCYGLVVNADNITIRDLQITNCDSAIRINAVNGTNLRGNHISFFSDNATGYTRRRNGYGVYVLGGAGHTIGGTTTAFRNYISGADDHGIYVTSNGTNISILNNMIGLDPGGNTISNSWTGIHLNGAVNTTIRNNMIAGSSYGIWVYTSDTAVIQGNIFGLYFDGATWSVRNPSSRAININFTSIKNTLIGGSDLAVSDDILNDSNVFAAAASGGRGIHVLHNNFYPTLIHGNFIGTNPEQDEVFPGQWGIYLDGNFASYTVIGGSGTGESGNVIANMSESGVFVATGANYVKISRNSFYNNGSSGAGSDDAILLQGSANSSITRPTIASANASTVTVDGVAAGDMVQVYLSDYDGSGTEYGEGKTFIGSTVAGSATAVIDVSAAGIVSGDWVTAIRRDTNSNTSSFSTNVQVVP